MRMKKKNSWVITPCHEWKPSDQPLKLWQTTTMEYNKEHGGAQI